MTLTANAKREENALRCEVQPLTFCIGAEIVGVNLGSTLSDDMIADIRSALLTYRVVFFRDQKIGIEEQRAFARRLGEITASHPTVLSANGASHVYEINSLEGGRADEWHTDVTYTDRPPAISILNGVVIPPYGGDTLWANTVAAYNGLPEALRTLVDGLRVIHTNGNGYTAANQDSTEATRKHFEAFRSTIFETEHPAVRVHPETKERSLLLGAFAKQVVGLSPSDSHEILGLLASHITTPDNTVRWRWRPDDVAVWDNRSTQHYAVHDYSDAKRVVQRVTVAGAIPVGVDGRSSRVLAGDASTYSPVGEF
jgi:taurine dioxygenase